MICPHCSGVIVGNEKFDIDLTKGEIRERYVEETLRGRIEVKADFRGELTGNHFLEFARAGKPSGIRVTTAKTWGVVLPATDTFLLQRTEILKHIGRRFYVDEPDSIKAYSGDHGYTSGVVIPLKVLFDPKKIAEYLKRGKGLDRAGLCPF